MTSRAFAMLFLAAGAAATTGCKKKAKEEPTSTAAGDPGAAGTPAGGGAPEAPGTPGSTAAGGEMTGLKPVGDCPKSLEGHDEGLDRTIKKACGPVPVQGEYRVDGSLTLEAGAQLVFQPGASLTVGYHKPSKLKVNGTAADPVRFTAGGDKVAGSWAGVRIAGNAPRSTLTGLVLEHGGDETGAIRIEAADVALKDVTIKDAAEIGVWVADDLAIKEASGLRIEQPGKVAISLPASAVGGVGEGNTFTAGSFVQIRGGTVGRDATWRNPGTHYVVETRVRVEGASAHARLTILAGTELRFRPGVEVTCGYHSAGSIDAQGTKDKPVVLQSADRDEPGTWQGIGAHGKGELTLTNTVVANGGENPDFGAVFATDGGVLTIKDSTIKTSTVGLSVTGQARLKIVDGTRFEGNTTAIAIFPDLVGKLGAANSYQAGQKIVVEGGVVATDQTWLPQPGAETQIRSLVDINPAKLTLAAGVELRFDGTGALFRVGYHDKATLRATGTADKPVILRGVRDDAGAWGGIQLHNRSTDNLLEHTVVQDADPDAAVQVLGGAQLGLKTVAFKRVKAAGVSWECGGKVTSAGVTIEGGGKAELKPTGC